MPSDEHRWITCIAGQMTEARARKSGTERKKLPGTNCRLQVWQDRRCEEPGPFRTRDVGEVHSEAPRSLLDDAEQRLGHLRRRADDLDVVEGADPGLVLEALDLLLVLGDEDAHPGHLLDRVVVPPH